MVQRPDYVSAWETIEKLRRLLVKIANWQTRARDARDHEGDEQSRNLRPKLFGNLRVIEFHAFVGG